MKKILKRFGRKITRSFHEKETFLFSVEVKSIMYGSGSEGRVQNGQHVFVSISRDSTKTILKADGQVVNGMVTFSQAQEHEQITLYAFDNSDRKKRGKSDTAKGSNTIISGYQAKFLKVTLVDVQGNKEVTKMDVAQFVGLKSIRHTLYFQNDFACINLIVSLIRDYSDIQGAADLSIFAQTTAVANMAESARNEPNSNAFNRMTAAVDESLKSSRAREIRTQSISDILPNAPSVPKIWTNLPDRPNLRAERAPKEKKSRPKLNLNGISNEGTSNKTFGGNNDKGTLSPTARHLLSNLGKAQDNKKPLLSPTAQHLLSRRFSEIKIPTSSKQRQHNDIQIQEDNSHSFVPQEKGTEKKQGGLLDAIRRRGGVEGLKKAKQTIAGQGSQETSTRNRLEESNATSVDVRHGSSYTSTENNLLEAIQRAGKKRSQQLVTQELQDSIPAKWDGKRKDPKSGRYYYYNKKTRETQWVDDDPKTEALQHQSVSGGEKEKIDFTKYRNALEKGTLMTTVRKQMIIDRIPLAAVDMFCRDYAKNYIQASDKSKTKKNTLQSSRNALPDPNKSRQVNVLKSFQELLHKGAPPLAVREKMLNARIPLKEIDQFFRRYAASKNRRNTPNPNVNLGAINPRLQHFLKMVRAGVPHPAVRQKMIMGRVPPHEINNFFRALNHHVDFERNDLGGRPEKKHTPLSSSTKASDLKQWDGKRKDPATGRWYFYNKKSRETMWEDEISKTKAGSNSPDKNIGEIQKSVAQEAASPSTMASGKLTKFKKMLSMGIPAPAVRQKMIMAEIPEADITSFFSEGYRRLEGKAKTPKSPNPKLQEFNSSVKLAKFKKMLSMGIPAPAVRQKMIMANISEADIASFFSEKHRKSAGETKKRKSTNPKLQKFNKMLSMGIPKAAIRQKMIMDSIPEAEINDFFGDNLSNGSQPSSGRKESLAPKQINPALKKFEKMLSMGIPKPAVKQKMVMAQISEAEIAAFFGNINGGQAAPVQRAVVEKPKSNLMKLHWEKMEKVPESSVWANVNQVETNTSKDNNIAKLKRLFAKNVPKSKASANGKAKSASGKKRRRSSIDGKRTQNIEIGLAQFKQFDTFDSVVAAVCQMNTDQLSISKVSTLVDICPTPLETKAVTNMLRQAKKDNNASKVSKAEQWVIACNKSNKFSMKCKTLLYVLQFSDSLNQISNRISMISNACRSITGSKSLKSVLANVLSIGNTMNQGTHAGDARGFKLDSLLKLTQTKSHDKKMTVLDFLVESEAEETSKSKDVNNLAGLWVNELRGLNDAARLRRKEMQKEFNQLKSGMDSIKRIADASPVGDELVGDFLELSFSSACNNFVSRHASKIQTLKRFLDEMITLCDSVALYFGENPESYDVSKAFSILHTFSKTYESSLKKYKERVERMKRMARRRSSSKKV